MTTIHQLPQHLINKLKAGEIVERPSSVVKELVENSLDAGATIIEVEIVDGGRKLIKVADNGKGLDQEDLSMTVQRYSTSKITTESDLEKIASYGFRGEALASISEVSLFRMQSRHDGGNANSNISQVTIEKNIGYELYKADGQCRIKEVPFAEDHGTVVRIEDLFYNVPARRKFLKSGSTEWGYISSMFISYALIHYDKEWKLINNGKVKRHVKPVSSLLERIQDVFKNERHPHLKPLAYQDEQLELYGVASDASLHFAGLQYVNLFVNQRPVQDRLVKKAVLDGYYKQLTPGTYPFVVLFVQIDPTKVDVNVHPRKSEVKFLDPGSMFSIIKETVQQTIGDTKVNYAAYNQHPVRLTNGSESGFTQRQKTYSGQSVGQGQQILPMQFDFDRQIAQSSQLQRGEGGTVQTHLDGEQVMIIGQVWESYIVLESATAIYYVDQHALAERIAFEKMRTTYGLQSNERELLLNPIITGYPADQEITEKIEQLNEFGFDLSLFGENKLIVHAVPKLFAQYKMDIELILQQAWGMEKISFDLILDEIMGMKACKASIKAGQRLSLLEMKQLIDDGMQYVSGMFVCQHGRPSVVKVEKRLIEGLFDR